jgi:hypothetical protein
VCDCDNELLGKMLTVKRVKELNTRDYFYQLLKDLPQMTAIYPGIEDECLKGAIDHHIHAYPDFVHRSQDMIEIAVDAARAGMRAVAFKDHYNLTAGAAYLVQQHIDHLYRAGDIPNRVEVYGGLGLNHGVDPFKVETAMKYPNMKMVWFPTFHSGGYLRGAGKDPRDGILLVDDNGEVKPEVVAVFELCARHKVGIGLGHTDFIELLPLCRKAKEIGARVVLDHPLLELNKLNFDEMHQLAELGAFVGTYCQPMIPSLYQPVADPAETPGVIKLVRAERCIIGSDFGQVLHIKSVDGIRIFVRALMAYGVTKEEIDVMLKTNPAKLLYLDE